MTNTRILGAMVELAHEGDAVRLLVEHDPVSGRWSASICVTTSEGGDEFTLPVFDPIHGETRLSGSGNDAADAVASLERTLEPFYPSTF